MPAFNSEKFISEAICSVLCQTYGNWELIIVNDGSTDSTYSQILNFTDSRISCHNISNSGVCYARNYGYRKARKDSGYIYFMDSDDVLLPTFIEESITAMIENNAKVVFCDYFEIDDNNNRLSSTYKFKNYFLSQNGVKEVTEESKLVSIETIYCNSVICESTTIFSYDCFKSSSHWDEHLSFAEGMKLFLELSLDYEFLYLNKELYCYRKYNSQSSRVVDQQKRISDISKVFKYLNQISRKNIRWFLKVFVAKAFFIMVREKELNDYLKFNSDKLHYYSKWKIKVILAKYKLIGPKNLWYFLKIISF